MFQDLETRLPICGHRGEGNVGTDTQKIQWIFLLLLWSLQRVLWSQLQLCSCTDYSTVPKMERKQALSFSSPFEKYGT